MAAALATGYLNFKDSQPEKAKEYLEHAVDLFDRADKLRSIGDDPEEQSYYKITTFPPRPPRHPHCNPARPAPGRTPPHTALRRPASGAGACACPR